MKRRHDLAYSNKNLSLQSRFLNDKQKLRDELVEDNNNNIKGQAPYECEIRPMSANGQSPYSTHAGTQNFRGYIEQLHGHFMPIGEGTPEQQAIQNGMCPLFNTNSPNLGEPVGSNGSIINLETNNREGPAISGNTRNLRGVTHSSVTSMAMIGAGGGGFGTAAGGFNFNNGTPAANIPNNPSSNKVEGSSFVVNGVRYESMPADDAAVKAIALRESAEAAGQGPYVPGKIGKWDGTPAGRDWVTKNIYLPVIKKNPDSYKNPEKSAEYFGSRLATDDESYWSSWFFRRCYEAYWDVNSANRTPGLDSSTVFDYTADQGLALRQKVESNPDSYKGQTVFLTFRSTEAPIFIGDAIWNSRTDNNSFDVLTPSGRQKPSHMKVITTTEGQNYRAIGGNEGKASTVNNVVVKVDSNKMLEAGSYYKAVYKRVVVVGREEGIT